MGFKSPTPQPLDQVFASAAAPPGRGDRWGEKIVGFPFSDQSAARRLAAIENEARINDPWERVLTTPFKLSAGELLERARSHRPRDPRATVSAFTEWIYSLYVGETDEKRKEEGTRAEASILECKRACGRTAAFRTLHPEWKLLHCGMDGGAEHAPAFEIRPLTLGGQVLRGSPDLVFRNLEDDSILILEVKFSMREVPSNLWPNVWAQLWAYSHIPEYTAAPRVEAVGEVWGWNTGSWQQYRYNSPVYLRHSVKRDPRNTAFTEFFRRLFEIYGGDVDVLGLA